MWIGAKRNSICLRLRSLDSPKQAACQRNFAAAVHVTAVAKIRRIGLGSSLVSLQPYRCHPAMQHPTAAILRALECHIDDTCHCLLDTVRLRRFKVSQGEEHAWLANRIISAVTGSCARERLKNSPPRGSCVSAREQRPDARCRATHGAGCRSVVATLPERFQAGPST